MNKAAAILWGLAATVVLAHVGAGVTRLRAANAGRRMPAEIDEAAILHAIAERETGNNPRAIGRLGERSRYQFTWDTWALHGHEAFERATYEPALADSRARKHLAYIRSVLRLRHLAESPAHIAAAWHYGPQFARICAGTDYVREVVALYECEVLR